MKDMGVKAENGPGRTLTGFIKAESLSGIVLLAVTVIAIIWMNSGLSEWYVRIWKETKLTIGLGGAQLSKPLFYWINDGLMAVFFLLVGLEIKREMLVGELADRRKALFPIIAAMGGMVVPALLYFAINGSDPLYRNGWAIPMATDIAFSLGVLALLGSRVPVALKVFLTALAIVDDMGAVLSIAVFYTDTIRAGWLLAAGGTFLLLILLNRAGLRNLWVFLLIGVAGLWLPLLLSGVHATIAGVLLALTIPAGRKLNSAAFTVRIRNLLSEYSGSPDHPGTILLNHNQMEAISDMHETCRQAESPLQKLEHHLKWPSMFIIMPVFALANTGVSFSTHSIPEVLGQPVAIGIMLGLVVGKVTGISLFSWLAVRFGWVKLPAGLKWSHLIGAGLLAGIGFTMSLFINELAFEGDVLNEVAKKAIFAASFISGLAGALWLIYTSRKKPA